MSDTGNRANRVETFLLTAIFAAVSVLLLLLLPWQTRSGPASSGWWTQPWLMPTIALSVLVLANLGSLARAWFDLRAQRVTAEERSEARTEIIGWFRPAEYFVYFLVYLSALKYLGYFLSTALFIQFLLYRVGLRAAHWRIAGLAAAVALTIVFRWGLGIWVPTAELYDLFPDAIRKFLTRWF